MSSIFSRLSSPSGPFRLSALAGLTVLAGATGLLLFCGGGGGGSMATPPPPPPPTNTIYVGGTNGGGGYGDGGTPVYAFNPVNLTVAAGTTVTWVWQGPGHSVDSGAGCTPDSNFSSGGLQNTGYTMTHTFNAAGTFPFLCSAHCASNSMKGTITVTP